MLPRKQHYEISSGSLHGMLNYPHERMKGVSHFFYLFGPINATEPKENRSDFSSAASSNGNVILFVCLRVLDVISLKNSKVNHDWAGGVFMNKIHSTKSKYQL